MTSNACPCGSGKPFELCCEAFLTGRTKPETAEELMRSRYSAYVRENIAYLKETLWPKFQSSFDFAATAKWASESHWTGLKVLGGTKGAARDREGTVLFEASYLAGGKLVTHRENSLFRKKSGRWYYVEAVSTP
ncbi:zinc chelation protein SecC [Roseibium polysiphoniae]|uniref:Zinc chelation protein SecC n=1 Tax=Roseibium polysiphoniae TaxID=2571221 RepID=A0A944CG52_9HYPH|nr:YchJ family metal-binding protein [Roseibium polysiphoniae]MBS8261962.1 zinc chelation protein SecC [Roseibium polysiphoniae]